MKHFLSAAALLAAGFFAIPGAANAASLPDTASLGQRLSGAAEQVDWRPFRHCHGRWNRHCHGSRFSFGGGHNRGRYSFGDNYRGGDRRGRSYDDRRGYDRRGDRDSF
jgi:hypothetical protein